MLAASLAGNVLAADGAELEAQAGGAVIAPRGVAHTTGTRGPSRRATCW